MPYFPEAKTPQEAQEAYARCVKMNTFRVKWKDIFNAKLLYESLYEWLKEHSWKSHEYCDFVDENFETLYFEKVGAAGDKELWIRWRVWKYPEHKENSYYKFHLDLDFHYLYLIATEVMHEGKKFKKDIYNGEVELKLSPYVQFDFKGEWSKHPVLKYFNQVFPNRIFKKDLYEEKKKELYREAYILQNYVKHYLKLKRFLPLEEVKPFHPSYSYPSYQRQA